MSHDGGDDDQNIDVYGTVLQFVDLWFDMRLFILLLDITSFQDYMINLKYYLLTRFTLRSSTRPPMHLWNLISRVYLHPKP